MNRLRMLIITLVLTLFSFENASAQEKPVITIAGIKDYRPYSYTENNRPEGLYNDILRELFQRTGYSLKIILEPFKRILIMTQKGDVTGMAGTFVTSGRKEFATFLLDFPLAGITNSLFVPKSGSIKSTNLTILKEKLIGRKRGFIVSAKHDSAVEKGFFKYHETETAEQLIKMLLLNRLDGFIHTTNNTLYFMNIIDKEKTIEQLTPSISGPTESYIAFSKIALKNLPETFIADVQKAINSMKSDGSLNAIYIKHNITNLNNSQNNN